MNKEFINILKEFIPDLQKEFSDLQLNENIIKILNDTNTIEEYNEVYEHSKEIFAEYFTQIISKDKNIFNDRENTEFIKGIYFSDIWNDTSERTQDILWKYLQLFLFTIMSDSNEKESLQNELSTLLQSIQEQVVKERLETLSGEKFELPEMNENVKAQMDSILNGKIGSFAKEIAKDTMEQFNLDETNSSQEDILKSMMQNPGKLMDITKNIGKKLEDKIEMGEMNEQELMMEATQMMEKIKHINIPGITDMFQHMNMNMNKKNSNATEHMMRNMKTRERLQKKLKDKEHAKQKLSGDGTNQVYTINDNAQKKTARKI